MKIYMTDIMQYIHHYAAALHRVEDVTVQSTGEHIQAERVDFHLITFKGNQWARGSQKIFQE